MKKHHSIWIKTLLMGCFVGVAIITLIIALSPKSSPSTPAQEYSSSDNANRNALGADDISISEQPSAESADAELYEVISVIDGDTIKIKYQNETVSVRLIGVNTPETVDPRTSVECYGQEASEYLKQLLTGKQVRIESDSSQANRDKYGRLLRYVYLNNEDIGLELISNGYGYEYTYDTPYTKQSAYRQAQATASAQEKGLWADGVCQNEVTVNNNSSSSSQTTTQPTAPSTSQSPTPCTIKGNISQSTGERIYHMPGQRYYDSTQIDPVYGERWFCTEAEAQAAGWRKSKV